MHIALMTETTGPGGLETMLITLAGELRERGHEVVPLIPSRPRGWLAESLEGAGFDVEFYPNPPGWSSALGSLGVILSILRRRRVQILHGHDFMASVLGTAAALAARIPSLVTLHGSTYYSDRWHRRSLLGWAARRSSNVVTVSGELGRRLAADLSLPEGHVDVVPNGTRLRKGCRSRGREILGLGPDDLGILAVGRIVPLKGLDVLVRALPLLGPGAERVRVAVAGAGPALEDLESMGPTLPGGRRIQYLGMREDVEDLMAGADIFVMPSRNEALPMALIEAMGAGLPVVASGVGGIPEVVENGREGWLVEPDDPRALAAALSSLIGDGELRDRFGEGGRRRVLERFTSTRMTEDYERLFQRAVSAG